MALTTGIETLNFRPSCCEYSSGRVFYGGRNNVYYSQVLEGKSISSLDKCYQQNDPTSEHISDILDTDGGVVQIDNATDIVQLKKFGSGIMVYASNGVWYLAGPEGGFTATNFTLSLVSNAGCVSPQGVVVGEASQAYWSKEGIYSISMNQFGSPEAKNIIEQSIQSFYNLIPAISKTKVTGSYNRINKQIEWFYPSAAQDGVTNYREAKDSSLILDTRTGGVWPQSYNATKSELVGDFIAGTVNTNVGSEDNDVVVVTIKTGAVSATQTYSVDFGTKTDTIYQDFGYDYPTAFIETGYETLNKPSNKKVVPYINTHFVQTEANFIDDGSGGLILDNQSGCQMRAKWDWNSSDDNGRWSPAQQAYRFRRVYIPDVAGPFLSGETVTTTKNKMLGRGEALSIRFEQEAQKDMRLLGYTCTYSVKGRM